MAEITVHERAEKTVEITPDFCFQKAAEALTGGYDRMQSVEHAREWRELGIAIAANHA